MLWMRCMSSLNTAGRYDVLQFDFFFCILIEMVTEGGFEFRGWDNKKKWKQG